MVDGVHFGEHTCVVALGIGIDGTKHPVAVEEGSTENATLVTDLITGLRDRGLDVTKPHPGRPRRGRTGQAHSWPRPVHSLVSGQVSAV
jgi:hypothetical protein